MIFDRQKLRNQIEFRPNISWWLCSGVECSIGQRDILKETGYICFKRNWRHLDLLFPPPFELRIVFRDTHLLLLFLCTMVISLRFFRVLVVVEEDRHGALGRSLRREGADPLCSLSRRGSDPNTLATISRYASGPGIAGPTATQNSPFLPRRWPKLSPILIAPIHGGWPGWVGLSDLDNT